jgi:hypothetical protein
MWHHKGKEMHHNDKLQPKQTKPYTVTDYLRAGCGQFKEGAVDLIALGIHSATGGLMCTGCPRFRSRCIAYARLANAPLHINSPPPATVETVRNEAKRRGISIGEVRRQRQAASGAA